MPTQPARSSFGMCRYLAMNAAIGLIALSAASAQSLPPSTTPPAPPVPSLPVDAIAQPDVASPILLAGDGGLGAGLAIIDADAVRALNGLNQVTISLPVSKTRTVDVTLDRFEVFTPDAVIESRDGNITLALPRPTVTLWRGSVVGQPDAPVFLSLSETRVHAIVQWQSSMSVITTTLPQGLATPDGRGIGGDGTERVLVYDTADVDPKYLQTPAFKCAGGILPPGGADLVPANGPAGYGERAVCRQFNVSLDADFQFSNALGGPVGATNYINTLIGAVSSIYAREVGITMTINRLVIWGASQPWTASGTAEALPEYSGWVATNVSTPRAASHLLSTRNLGGGIAYVNSLCGGSAYAVSGNMNGTFPFPIVDNSWSNWDLMVVSHEFGHVFGSGHTHSASSYNPIIDGCGNGDCTVAQAKEGTIMSYCHICAGGMSNMKMTFGPRVITRITQFAYSRSCSTTVSTPVITSAPGDANVCAGDNVSFTVNATGTGTLSYQWFRNGLQVGGQTSPTLSLPNISAGSAGRWTCRVTNLCGSTTTESIPGGNITVTAPAVLGISPQSTSVVEGDSIVLSGLIGGTSVNFQWTKDNIPVSNSARTSGANSATLMITSAQLSDAGVYRLTGTNSCRSVVTNPATLTVTVPTDCPADFDQSGGTPDAGDVDAFFIAWLAGDNAADFDESGGTPDASDVDAFFIAWLGGC
jgi:hypothetical protein